MRNKSLFILTMLGLSFFSRAQTSSLFDTITPIRQATMRSVLDTSNAYGISSMDSIETDPNPICNVPRYLHYWPRGNNPLTGSQTA